MKKGDKYISIDHRGNDREHTIIEVVNDSVWFAPTTNLNGQSLLSTKDFLANFRPKSEPTFRAEDVKILEPETCICEMSVLMCRGCQCGAIQKERGVV